MTFIQHEDFISDLRYNIHAAKLHFFCVPLLKSSNRIAKGARLWITSVAKVTRIVVWNNHSYSKQNSYHQAPWSMDTHSTYCTLELITLLQLRRIFVKLCWQSTSYYRYSIRRSVQNCKSKRKRKFEALMYFNPINQHSEHTEPYKVFPAQMSTVCQSICHPPMFNTD